MLTMMMLLHILNTYMFNQTVCDCMTLTRLCVSVAVVCGGCVDDGLCCVVFVVIILSVGGLLVH